MQKYSTKLEIPHKLSSYCDVFPAEEDTVAKRRNSSHFSPQEAQKGLKIKLLGQGNKVTLKQIEMSR